jgi:ATP synthase protein I
MNPPPEQDPASRKADGWHDPPDAWAQADRDWNRAWPPRDEGDEVAPLSADYQPRPASARGVARAYGDGMHEAGPYLGLGAQIAASMLFFVGAGYALDHVAGTSPWGVLVGALLGMVAILVLVTRLAREANAASARQRAQRKRGEAEARP